MFQKRSNKTPKAFINKEDASSLRQEVVAARKISPTIIASDVRLLGNIMGDGVLDVDAQVEGNITASVVYVRANGMITGDVIAQSEAHIFGSVHGVIRAQRVCIYPSAHIEGVIMHRSVMVEDGAYVNAQFKPTEPHNFAASSETSGAYFALLEAIQAQPVEPASVHDRMSAIPQEAPMPEEMPIVAAVEQESLKHEVMEDRTEPKVEESIEEKSEETPNPPASESINTIPVSTASITKAQQQNNLLLHADEDEDEYNILKGLKLIS